MQSSLASWAPLHPNSAQLITERLVLDTKLLQEWMLDA